MSTHSPSTSLVGSILVKVACPSLRVWAQVCRLSVEGDMTLHRSCWSSKCLSMFDKVYCTSCSSRRIPAAMVAFALMLPWIIAFLACACMNETFVSPVFRFLLSRCCICARLFRVFPDNITGASLSLQAVEPKARRTLASQQKARIGSHNVKHHSQALHTRLILPPHS